MFTNREEKIINFIKNSGFGSTSELFNRFGNEFSIATIKRDLKNLVDNNFIKPVGKGRSTKYIISETFELLQPIDIEKYFSKEIDERNIKKTFNFQLLNDVLSANNIFTKSELKKLHTLQRKFAIKISQLSEMEYKKEYERLAIDLSWKSSQIEGNTYSLLETEILLKEKLTASGKTKDEAIMLLNHKDALDFIFDNTDYLYPLQISKIEDIHKMLTKELNIESNLRKRRVGIIGTNYLPLDNQFQINEALKKTCHIVNQKESVFEKALLALVLISYIQPFTDGNKRTSRIVSNAILINEHYCPISFRTVESIDYKKAMLLFYEQNNISAFKEIFIQQYEFAIETYF